MASAKRNIRSSVLKSKVTMRALNLALLISFLWNGIVYAGFEFSDMLFRPNMLADKALMDHAKITTPTHRFQTQEDSSIEVEIDLCNPENFQEIFQELMYDPDKYTRYQGLDHTSLFASSVTLSDKYAVVGSNGYDVFKGIVHVYVPKSASKWSLQALIRSPVWDNGNFGSDVSIDDDRMAISANAYEKYDGIVFVYEHVVTHNCWLRTGTIYSPLASGANRTLYQGFGYRVDMSGEFLIASTSVNNAYIFKEVTPGNWTLHTNLLPPAPGIYFGRSVAISNDIAIVGAYGYDRNVGRVYIYRYSPENDTWNLADQLKPSRNETNFGFSLDLYNTSIIVGANGYNKFMFENKDEFDARLSQPSVNYGWASVFQLSSDGEHWELEQEIASPVGNNSYFGAGVGIYEDSIIVGADGYPCFGLTGAGFVYNKEPTGWILNQSYPSPAGHEGHFGYAVDINANYSAIGAYGFDFLRGSIYLADRRPHKLEPSDPPFFLPTAPPSSPTDILSGGGLDRTVGNTGLTLGTILALALGFLIVSGSTGLIIYCCCCMVPIIPLLKKKKKKEEEDDSPYTVHSYAGYVENEYYPPPVVLIEDEAIKKDLKKEKSVKFMENGEVRKMFPYKVYGPRGYKEEGVDHSIPEDLLRQKKESDDEMSSSVGKSTGDEIDSSFYYHNEDDSISLGGGKGPPLRTVPTSDFNYDSFYSRPSSDGDNYTYHDESMYFQQQQEREAEEYHHENATTSLVDRARSHYEQDYLDTGYSQSNGSRSMSSITSKSHNLQQNSQSEGTLHTPRTISASSMTSSQKSYGELMPYDFSYPEDDDRTVMSHTTEATYKSGGYLLNAAQERYERITSSSTFHHQEESFHQTTTHNTTTKGALVSAIKEKYHATKTSETGSSHSDSSYIDAVKDEYRRRKSTGTYSQSGTEFNSSITDQTKLSEGETLMTTSDVPSHVLAARSKYAQLSGIASSSADIGDTGSVVSHTSVGSGSSSAVEAIKAKYAMLRAQGMTKDSAESTTGVSTAGGASSLVDNIRARYYATRSESSVDKASAVNHPTDMSAQDDDSTILTQSTTASSGVNAARAKYAQIQRQQQQENASVVSSGTGSAASQASSFVEAARLRGEALKRNAATVVTHTLPSDSEPPSSVVDSEDQSSFVDSIKARYKSDRHQQHRTSTMNTSVYSTTSQYSSGQTRFEDSDTAGASSVYPASDESVGNSTFQAQQSIQSTVYSAQSQNDSVSEQSHEFNSDNSGIAIAMESAPTSTSSTEDVARSAAMNKFALYRAKAEAEARSKLPNHSATTTSTGEDSTAGVKVMLRERGAPLRQREPVATMPGEENVESEWTLEDTTEGVSKMSVSGSETSHVAAEEEHSGISSTTQEDTKARAREAARERYNRAKELSLKQQQDKQSQGAPMATTPPTASTGRSAIEEARRRLRESQEASNIPLPEPVADLSSGMTMSSTHRTTATTRSTSQTALHSKNESSTHTTTAEVTHTTVPSSKYPAEQP